MRFIEKRKYHYGGYYIGFGIRYCKFFPTIWIWFSDFMENSIVDKKFALQFVFDWGYYFLSEEKRKD